MIEPAPTDAAAYRPQLADGVAGPEVVAVDAGAPPVIVLLDQAGTILDVAPTGAALLGTTELLGRDLHELVTPEERAALSTVIHHALTDDGQGDRAFEALLTGRRADGLPLVVRVSAPGGMDTSAAALVLERWGGPVQWSQEPPLPAPARSGPDHLLSHDARGAVRNARNFAGIFARKVRAAGPAGGPPLDAAGEPLTLDLLDTALRSAANADEMLERIVWFIRLEHDPLVMQRIPLDTLVELARHRAGQMGDELAEAHDEPDLAGSPAVHVQAIAGADAAFVELVGVVELLTWCLAELFVNARKFGGAETQITVTVHPTGDSVELLVLNTGTPIDPALAEDAFRLGRLLQPRGDRPGIGMGLPLVRRIVTRHGGRVQFVAAAAGSDGTTIRLRLPAVAPENLG